MKLLTVILSLVITQPSKLLASTKSYSYSQSVKLVEPLRQEPYLSGERVGLRDIKVKSLEALKREADAFPDNIGQVNFNQPQSAKFHMGPPIITKGIELASGSTELNLVAPSLSDLQQNPAGAALDSNSGNTDTEGLASPNSFQQDSGSVTHGTTNVKPAGRWCIKKIDYVDRLEKTQLLECEHKNITQCHQTYVTHFTPHVEQICIDDFIKTCHITFTPKAINNTVKNCEKPYKEVCPEYNYDAKHVPQTVCKVHFVTQCSNVVHPTTSGNPHLRESGCWKVPRRICAPDFCKVVEGPEECYEKVIGATVDEPEEQCHLQPNTICRNETRLLPKLIPQKVCRSVPKDVCSVRHHKAKPVQKAVELKWCTEEEVEQEDGQEGQGQLENDLTKKRETSDYGEKFGSV